MVLLFVDARQGLVLSEAVERVDGGAAPAMGRPACAVIPRAVNRGASAMSLGCCGARAYLDAMTDDVALWALPGSGLEAYCEQIAVLAGANRTLAAFHERRKTDVESGERPTVRESLARALLTGPIRTPTPPRSETERSRSRRTWSFPRLRRLDTSTGGAHPRAIRGSGRRLRAAAAPGGGADEPKLGEINEIRLALPPWAPQGITAKNPSM